MSEQALLLRVCSLLNSHGAQDLVVGARACWLHGYVRATTDVDILVPEDLENHARVIAALSELKDHAAAELVPQDLVENVVVKIADEGNRCEHSCLEGKLRQCNWHSTDSNNRRRGSSVC